MEKIDIKKIIKAGKIDQIEKEKLEATKPVVPNVTEEAMLEFSIKVNRDRFPSEDWLPEYLPTFGFLPFPIDEHTHIGLYESKQNLYLTMATYINRLTDRIKVLEQEIQQLKNQP